MARKRFKKVTNIEHGVPYEPTPFEICCDCGLVHKNKYEVLINGKVVKNAKIRITTWRHNGHTHAERIERLKKKQGFARYHGQK